MDRLLRGHLGNRAQGPSICRGFDADLANAYVEHRMSAGEVAGYEGHLSMCAPCRTSVVALARMSEAEAATASSLAARGTRAGAKQARLGRFSGWLLTLSRPQWAAVAVATIMLAVGIPLLLSQRATQSARSQIADAGRSEGSAPEPAAKEVASAGYLAPAQPSEHQFRPAAPRSTAGRKSGLGANSGGVVGGAAAASADQNRIAADSRQNKTDTKSEEQGERKAGTDTLVAKAQVSGPRVQADEKKQLPLIDKEKARRLPTDDKDTTSVAVLKPGDPGAQQKTTEGATIKSEAIAPPPAEPRADAAAVRKEIAQPAAKMMLRDGRESDAPRGRSLAEPMKIGKKKFFLIKDTWTDEAYDPTKELPVVTLIRDSDVYNEEIAKHKDLKVYLTKFAADQRAIIVHNKTVYKVIPQEQK